MSMWKASGRGFDSRRLHHILLLFLLLPSVLIADSITVFEGAKKTQLTIQTIEGSSYLKLTDLQPFLGFKTNAVAGNLSVSIGQHNVLLSPNRSIVSVDEKLVSLSHPVYVAQSDWLVPLDFIPKVLKITSEKQLLWLDNSHSLLLGDITPNQLVLRYSMETDHSRLVFQSNRPVGFIVTPDSHGLTIQPQSDDFLLAIEDTPFTDGVLKKISVQKKSFRIDTDEQFANFKAFDLQDPPRFVIDFYRKASAAPAATAQTAPPPAQAPPTLLPSTTPEKKVIVIDPGHGGSETGATGKDGAFEKDITLAIANKLKSLLESNTGVRVILTRSGDQQIGLDDRTALANNNKADLFISIHANSTVHGMAKGAETYFLSTRATDDESRSIAAIENNAIGLNQDAQTTVDPDLKLILWDMAQTEYLAESSQLAEYVQQELNSTLGVTDRGIKQAPFRVLMGATMPAVLIEVGFINNPAEEKLMEDSDYQMKIARAILRSIEKFQGAQGTSVASGK